MVNFIFPLSTKQPIRNIIFDLGGVLFNVDYNLTINEFIRLGVQNFEQIYSQMNQQHFFNRFEKGEITANEFRREINQIASLNLTSGEIDKAWNAMLLGLPEENIRFIERIGKEFQLFLLSNTNQIHIEKFYEMIRLENGLEHLDCYFEKIYLSHLIGARKPEAKAFEIILTENNLTPAETLFVDDSPRHVEGAIKTGIQAVWLKPGMKITDLFEFTE
jgi:glucose-1-phosphatase